MFYRIAALTALSTVLIWAQTAVPAPAAIPPSIETPVTTAETPVPTADPPIQLEPDVNDPGVVRAQKDLERIRLLIKQGALPAMRLRRAEEDLENAKDMSILRWSLVSQNLAPEQADQMVTIAQRMVMRRERSLIEMQQLVSSGVISRAEAAASGADFDRAQTELHLAQTRARLIQQMAETVRIEKGIASLEMQAETHPDWAGKIYTRYDGKGVVTPSDIQRVSLAFSAEFARPLPISADGQTALHTSLGFDHRGRVDVAVNPDQPEGAWLMRYLESNRIPYFAFRMAVPGRATGAHIHIGPQSTRLALSY